MAPIGSLVSPTNSSGFSGTVAFQDNNACTLDHCAVTLGKKTFNLNDLKTNPQARINFLVAFYAQFAPGWGQAELDFVRYLSTSGRITGGSKYWDVTDYEITRDQLLAAYEVLNSDAAQSRQVGNWMTFMAHHSNDSWWAAHNGSINAADQRAKANGLYGKESFLERRFINETVNVINSIQVASQGNSNPISGAFSPQTSNTGTLAGIFYPTHYDDASVAESFALQASAANLGGGPTGLGVFFALLF